MWFKLFDEDGEYKDKTTGERKNLVWAEYEVFTPDGLNVGWVEFGTIEEAMEFFNIEDFSLT